MYIEYELLSVHIQLYEKIELQEVNCSRLQNDSAEYVNMLICYNSARINNINYLSG